MKSLLNRVPVIAALALAAVFVSAVPASAQSRFKGSFTLPHYVRWQGAVLAPGDYTFEIRSLADRVMVLKGPSGSRFITAVIVDQMATDASMLIVENRGAESFVSELCLGSSGRSLRYSVPKASKDVELAQGPVTRERILVAVK